MEKKGRENNENCEKENENEEQRQTYKIKKQIKI